MKPNGPNDLAVVQFSDYDDMSCGVGGGMVRLDPNTKEMPGFIFLSKDGKDWKKYQIAPEIDYDEIMR